MMQQSGHVFASMGETPEDEIVDHDPKGVAVAFDTVHVAFESLERHEEGTAYFVALYYESPGVTDAFCKTEIAYLPLVALTEDVGWFEVAVDNILSS